MKIIKMEDNQAKLVTAITILAAIKTLFFED